MFEGSDIQERVRLLWLVVAVGTVAVASGLPAAADDARVARSDSAIAFGSDLEDARGRARVAGKPVFLAFGAAWCPVCRRMEEQTLLEPAVQALAEKFVWVKVDIDRKRALAQEWGVQDRPERP